MLNSKVINNSTLSPMTPSPKNNVNIAQNVNYQIMNIPSVPLPSFQNMIYSQPMIQIQPVLYGLQPNLYGIFGVNNIQNQQYQAKQAQNESIKKQKEQCPPVSLLTITGCRYHGQLYTVDVSEQSIALKHVSCHGTEGRMNGKKCWLPKLFMNMLYFLPLK